MIRISGLSWKVFAGDFQGGLHCGFQTLLSTRPVVWRAVWPWEDQRHSQAKKPSLMLLFHDYRRVVRNRDDDTDSSADILKTGLSGRGWGISTLAIRISPGTASKKGGGLLSFTLSIASVAPPSVVRMMLGVLQAARHGAASLSRWANAMRYTAQDTKALMGVVRATEPSLFSVDKSWQSNSGIWVGSKRSKGAAYRGKYGRTFIRLMY